MMTQQGLTPGEVVSDVTVSDVRFEHHRDAFGIGEAQPRLSWIVATTARGWCQACYEVETYSSDGLL